MPKHIWLLIIGMTVNVTGASFIWPLNTIYMHNELGKSLAFAGVILMLNQGFAILGNLVGGTLFDKFGGYKTIMLGTSIAMVSASILAFFNSIVPYVVLLMLIGLGSGMVKPSMFALASSAWPEGGRRAFNAIYVAQNLGVALGASLGGFVAALSFSYIFIANAITFFIFFLLVWFKFKPIENKLDNFAYTGGIDQPTAIANKEAFKSLIILSIGFFICWVAYVQWQTTISSYTQDLGISISSYSLLWTINGVLIVAGQPLVKLVASVIPSPKTHIYIGNTIFMLSFIYVSFADSFAQFATGMVILTLGEMLVWPSVPTLADQLAPKGKTGFYQGIINGVSTAGRMIGPVLGGLIVDHFHIQFLFYILIFLFTIPYITTSVYDRKFRNREIHDTKQEAVSH
ncbi:MDR family MFS transporter [Salinibacillus xinjiangensis]|uniref:MFS transporter n=1 Tax=Salinibacillus xinjiangensis TaxID=1229268 RepID=A0A6G1X5Y7_9BACI|nr:MFS transporter [Salinibacillus xinjiangensis]MRG86352.1 MFS transporter [Salinibacillus xinjiangensis]